MSSSAKHWFRDIWTYYAFDIEHFFNNNLIKWKKQNMGAFLILIEIFQWLGLIQFIS
jgi:hypothetical protein